MTSSRIARVSSRNIMCALVAVLDERVLLRHPAQMDALAHVVHVLEVLAPADVDDLEHDVALEIAHEAFLHALDLLLALGVGVERVVEELLDDRIAVEPLAQLVGGDARPVERAPSRDEAVEIPLLGISSRGVLGDGARDHLGNPLLAELLGEVLALEHAAALLVDHLRWTFITSSYLRTFLRATKFCSSTFFCALSIWFERIFASIGWSSGSLKRSMML